MRTLLALFLTLCFAVVRADDTGHPAFMSPHAGPIVINGDHVFVTNTPADTVDVIDMAARSIVARIRVGIDPVGIAARPDGREVWVSNHVSDSVNVIDIDPTSASYLQIIATVQDFDPVTRATRFDEPVGIAFAGNDKAYVALSSENRIAVIDTGSYRVTKTLEITAQDPRAITVRNERLYVIPFESNNQTQISGCVGRIDGNLCTFDAQEHVIDNNNVLSLHAVVDIVRNPQVPDRDLYVFDTTNDSQIDVVNTLGTLLYGIAVDSTGQVYIAQTDARNDVNGRAGSLGEGLLEMENRAFLNRLTHLDCGADCGKPGFIELEPLPPVHPSPGHALATPFAVAISDDDSTLVASAAGSNMIFTLDTVTGHLLGRTTVGSAPRGVALQSHDDGKPVRAWVYNAVENSVSVVDVSDPATPFVIDTIELVDPTHPAVKRGRIAFNDAGASTTGTFSCESCHPDGGTDQLLWVLDTPPCSVAGCDQIPPRITMPIRGLRDTAPYHWDGIPGDPYGGINTASIWSISASNCSADKPESCTRHVLDGSLATTMCEAGTCPINEEGKDGALTAAERDDMAKFLLSVPYPPSLRRAWDNVPSRLAKNGFRLFHVEGDFQGDPEPNVCGDCHRMPFWVSTNTPGTGMDAPTWRGAYDRWLILPQGRLNLIDFDFYRHITVSGTPERNMWRFSWASRSRFDPVWNMVTEGSTGFSGSFGRQVTLNRSSALTPETGDLLGALEKSAADGGIVLQAEGIMVTKAVTAGKSAVTGTPLTLRFNPRFKGGKYVDRSNPLARFSRDELVALAEAGEFIGTFTARLGVNVDVDHPQPAIWSRGTIQHQRGRQDFPNLTGDDTTMVLSGRHIRKGANVYIDGRRVPGTVSCQSGELPDCVNELIEVRLEGMPLPADIHLLQVQNPDGLFSNDFIVFSWYGVPDNCPDIRNPSQADSDGDGDGDRCDEDAFDFSITPGISGTWYDPEHSGEGWFVQFLDEERAVVYWFTFTPPGFGNERSQAWIGGVGHVNGSGIVVPEANAIITEGPSFGPAFDREHVARYPWGEFALNFSDCNNGVMYYRSRDPDYGNGSMNLLRLTSIGDLDCGGGAASTPETPAGEGFEVTPAISGAWYDPNHSGEGWLLEVNNDGQAVVAWFSYDAEGNQAWFLNKGSIEGDTISFDLSMPSGTDFGPTFEPDAVSRPPWGSAVFKFDGCNAGLMSYDSPLEGYGSGQLELVRLTSVAGLECH